MKDTDFLSFEALAKPHNRLWCQRDFGNEDEATATTGDDFTQSAQVNFRLATAGDPVKKDRPKLLRLAGLYDRPEGTRLAGVERSFRSTGEGVEVGLRLLRDVRTMLLPNPLLFDEPA
jgi:hypothetical protein